MLGGLFGVIYAVPLRRVLLFDRSLRFPEGRAIGQVLIATGGDKSTGFKELVWGGLISAGVQFAQSGLQCLAESFEYWSRHERVLWGYGLGFSPALLGAGYIIGINVGLAIGCGILIGWLLGIPILSWHFQTAITMVPLQASQQYWQDYIRYMGVGTMLVGGVWALLKLLRPLLAGLKVSMQSLSFAHNTNHLKRTEADIPFSYLLIILVAMIIPFIFLV